MSASALARRLAREAEAVCRHYLGNGRREGRYWLVGDVFNTPGRSLYVRLTGPDSGRGAAGKWTDAATGQHGDLLDLIALNCGHGDLSETLDEGRAFLRLPKADHGDASGPRADRADEDTIAAARRLFAASRPIAGTLAAIYLAERGIDPDCVDCSPETFRFHPRCRYREHARAELRELPALIAAVTDDAGGLVGIHRTWLDASGRGKARIESPRRSMGAILGHGVRLGWPKVPASFAAMIAGEGLETLLSLRMILDLPVIAATSAAHLAALKLPLNLRRLYIALDQDQAGRRVVERLSRRARESGIETFALQPALGDMNDDLRRLGPVAMAANLSPQLAPADIPLLGAARRRDRARGSRTA